MELWEINEIAVGLLKSTEQLPNLFFRDTLFSASGAIIKIVCIFKPL